MRVILYNSGLGPKIPTRQKTSTIRGFTVSKKTGRKGGGAKCKPGDELSHRVWTGKPYRSKQQEIHRSICKRIRKVQMYWDNNDVAIRIDGEYITHAVALQLLADQEGFENIGELKDYFKKSAKLNIGWHPKPFEGEMIEWE